MKYNNCLKDKFLKKNHILLIYTQQWKVSHEMSLSLMRNYKNDYVAH